MNRTTLLIAGLFTILLPGISIAACPDAIIQSVIVDKEGNEKPSAYVNIRYKDKNNSNELFFKFGKTNPRALCEPDIEAINKTIATLQAEEAKKGLKIYLDINTLGDGVTATDGLKKLLQNTKDAALSKTQTIE